MSPRPWRPPAPVLALAVGASIALPATAAADAFTGNTLSSSWSIRSRVCKIGGECGDYIERTGSGRVYFAKDGRVFSYLFSSGGSVSRVGVRSTASTTGLQISTLWTVKGNVAEMRIDTRTPEQSTHLRHRYRLAGGRCSIDISMTGPGHRVEMQPGRYQCFVTPGRVDGP